MLSAMSSFNHRPKRKHNEVDLVFPSHYTQSLEETKEFAKKSQNALDSLGNFTTANCVFLPFISPNGLQYRFDFDGENSIFAIIRQSYNLLKEEVQQTNSGKSLGIYLRGPVGVGKSYLLYILAAEHRLYRKTCRVTYVNDCASWRDNKYGYILNELVTTFYDDTIDNKSIVEWCEAVIGKDTEAERKIKMEKLIKELFSHVVAKDLTWIVIFDQHNAFYVNTRVDKVFPFSLVNSLAKNRSRNIKVIVSASANNEGYPTEMKGWKTHDISSHRFDDNEFSLWCDQYLLKDDVKVDPKSEDAVDALFWSGGIPHELDLLWKQPKKSLIEKTMLYRQERVKEFAESHGKFYKRFVIKEVENLGECISRMALCMSPPEIDVGMDHQLFDIVQNEDGSKVITALNPIARRALLAYHGKGLITSLGMVAEIVLQEDDYTNDTKGRIIEKYITTVLELSQRLSFQYREITCSGLSVALPKRHVKIKSIVHFAKNGMPPQSSFNRNVNTLYVPESPNYPGFDFFIWDSARQRLMGFQVTVLNPFTNHSKMNSKGQSNNYNRWQNFCYGNLTSIELYWIVPQSCVGEKPQSVDDYVIFLEDLCDDFPALTNVVLKEKSI
ncbi:hypothetical protein HDV06_003578 [Boothiomyces sp. JEL0866]|nr:hypothetical protein HDV06_003578 [Boothiomyces sp. JEL0866]